MPGTLVGNGLLPMPLKINATALDDGSDLITVLQNSQISVYRVVNNFPTLIGSSNGAGKCDSGDVVVRANGDVILYVSQADNIVGSSGSTSKIYTYKFPNAVPTQLSGGTVDAVARNKITNIQFYLGGASNV